MCWQDCTHVPFSTTEHLSEKDVKSTRVQQRIMGTIVHGYGRFFHFIDPELLPKGANQCTQRKNPYILHIIVSFHGFSVITILNEVLGKVREQPKFDTSRVLSIQFDGASENWNQQVLAWCHMLVYSRAFDEVSLNREHRIINDSAILSTEFSPRYLFLGLPPGHTHEDVDALFSHINQALLGRNAISKGVKSVTLRTVNELMDFVDAIFKHDNTVTRR